MSVEQSPTAQTSVRGISYRLTLLPRPDLVGKRGFWPDGYRRAAVAGDAAAAVVSCLLAQFAHSGQHPAYLYLIVTPLLPAAWISLVALARCYGRDVLCSGAEERRRIALVGAVLITLTSGASFLLAANMSRLFVVLGAIGSVAGSLLVREVLRRRLEASRRAGRDLQRVLVVGHADLVASAIEAMDHQPEVGLVPIAACLPTDGRRVTPPTGIPLTADVEPVLAMLEDIAPDAVLLVSDLDLAGMAARRLAEGVHARRLALLVSARADVASWLPNPQPVRSPRGLDLVRSTRPEGRPAAA